MKRIYKVRELLCFGIKDEIMEQISYIREWGAKFVIPIPMLRISQ